MENENQTVDNRTVTKAEVNAAPENTLDFLRDFESMFYAGGMFRSFKEFTDAFDGKRPEKLTPTGKAEFDHKIERVAYFKKTLDIMAAKEQIAVLKEDGTWAPLQVNEFNPKKTQKLLISEEPGAVPFAWSIDEKGKVTMSDGPVNDDDMTAVFSGGKVTKPQEPSGFFQGFRKLINNIRVRFGADPLPEYAKYNEQMQEYERNKYYTLTANGFNREKPDHVEAWEQKEAVRAQAEKEAKAQAEINRVEGEKQFRAHLEEKAAQTLEKFEGVLDSELITRYNEATFDKDVEKKEAFLNTVKEAMSDNTMKSWGIRHFIKDCGDMPENRAFVAKLYDDFDVNQKDKLTETLGNFVEADFDTSYRYTKVIPDRMKSKMFAIQKEVKDRTKMMQKGTVEKPAEQPTVSKNVDGPSVGGK